MLERDSGDADIAGRTFRGKSRLAGIAGWAPSRRVTTEEIEKRLVDIPACAKLEIESRSGVRERRFRDPNVSFVDMALAACDKLLSQTDVSREDIDLVIYCGVCRQYVEPATANAIHARLGLKRAVAFDVADACLGFVDGWMIADAMIAAGRARCALLVSAEAGSLFTEHAIEALRAGADPRPHFASLTLGDGAAAAIVAPSRSADDGVVAGLRESHGEHYELCIIDRPDTPMRSQASRLLNLGFSHLIHNVGRLLSTAGWQSSDIDLVVAHQPSASIFTRGEAMLGIDVAKAVRTVETFGNMASVSLPFALATAFEEGRAPPGTNALLLGFGSGLGIGMMAVRL